MTWQEKCTTLVKQLEQRGITHPAVLRALRTIPRHLFVREKEFDLAYQDRALAIAQQQTISQPYIVAYMTQTLLADQPSAKVLEIGTGSGYQAAILAQCVKQVYTIERFKALHVSAKHRLQNLNFHNIHFLHGDGSLGWPEFAPYDGIIVTAAPTELPTHLLQQLADDGRMVIPLGKPGEQSLHLVTRHGDSFTQQPLLPVAFVPMLTGKL